jgi:drug/metabolite transporter (DMT)-like permease
MYYISMAMVIIASIFYHISQKGIATSVNPLISLVATYGTALITTMVMFLFFPLERGELVTGFKSLNAHSYILGVVIVLLEVGYLLVYRSGWNISYASIFVNSVVMILLIPIGVLIYREGISGQTGIGILLCLAGIILINRK